MFLVDWIRELFVELPQRANRKTICDCACEVKALIAVIQRKEEAERRKAEEKRQQKERDESKCSAKKKLESGKSDDSSDSSEGVRFSRGSESATRYSVGSAGGKRWSITVAPGHSYIPPSRCVDDPLFLRSAKSRISEMDAGGAGGFSNSLQVLVRQRCGGNAPLVYRRAGLTRQAYSRIISDRYAKVEKLTAMRLCIGLQLTRSEADRLLGTAGFVLSENLPVDRVFIFCMNNAVWNIMDVCSIFEASGLKPFDVSF